MMTTEQAREIMVRCERATPGPWYVKKGPSGQGNNGVGTSGDKTGAISTIFGPGHDDYGYSTGARIKDAEFIAYARQDIPALLDALEAERTSPIGTDATLESIEEAKQRIRRWEKLYEKEIERLIEAEADRDRYKARAETLERAIRRNYTRQKCAELTCDTCMLAETNACDPTVCGVERTLWQFNEAKFAGGD